MPSDRSISFGERIVMMWPCPECGKYVGEGVVKGAYARHEDNRHETRPRCARSFTPLIGQGVPGQWGIGPRKHDEPPIPGQEALFPIPLPTSTDTPAATPPTSHNLP